MKLILVDQCRPKEGALQQGSFPKPMPGKVRIVPFWQMDLNMLEIARVSNCKIHIRGEIIGLSQRKPCYLSEGHRCRQSVRKAGYYH